MEEILMSRDTTIFLLQYLYFILNMEKSTLTPVQEIEFLGLTVNSVKMKLSFPEQQIKRIQDQCQDLCLKADKTYRSFSFNNPSCITGTIKLSISSAATDKCSKTQWVISRGPVPEQGVKERTTVVDSKLETLPGSVENTTSVLCYNKKRCLQEVVGCILSRDTTRGEWTSEEKEMHINILELKAVRLALISFHKQMKMKAVHFQIDNITALMYLLKMGDTGNKRLLDLINDMWE